MGILSDIQKQKSIMHDERLDFDTRFEALKNHTKLKSRQKQNLQLRFKTKTRLQYENKLKTLNP